MHEADGIALVMREHRDRLVTCAMLTRMRQASPPTVRANTTVWWSNVARYSAPSPARPR